MAFCMESSLEVKRVDEAVVEHVSSDVGLLDGRGGIFRRSCSCI
jgi:hypothetical protein